MKTTEPRAIHLKDYRPPAWRISEIALDFVLEPEATRVTATSHVERLRDGEKLALNGHNLKLLGVKVNGKPLAASEYALEDETLTLADAPAKFTLEIQTEIAPAKNTELMGLYMASGIYCTQCEPEGFRAITFYLDRPDNLAKFETRIEAPKDKCPVLLSNGNPIARGELPGGRHFVRWQDPFPKPSYLFALVAGDLGHIADSFTTMTGRKIALEIYVEHGNENRALYAMDSLKRAMKWDEDVYGREYDLDIFMIVAVSAFNFGAMENKGLNIFNDKVLLASPETATDDDYARIESVVAHEYFHNWTGDRITCRDWFQLSLKEGLTVFRDQGFSADMRSQAVKRIEDVKALRLRQFQEDSGPLAHPVQPQSYMAIDNFYTATVYEKGAEVIRMIKTLVGQQDFRKGMDLYFARHDGQAATVEDFVRCFEDAAKKDLSQFRLWYSQAGTPQIDALGVYDASAKTYTLDIKQRLAPTPGQNEKRPMAIPLATSLLSKQSGEPLPLHLPNETGFKSEGGGVTDEVLEIRKPEQRFVFSNVREEPVLSIGRGFSAPVIINTPADRATRAFLMARETDSFNRWEAGQKLVAEILLEMIAKKSAPDPMYLEAAGAVLKDAEQDPAFTALMLMPPSEQELALAQSALGQPVDPEAIHYARKNLIGAIASAHGARLAKIYDAMKTPGPYSPAAQDAGKRSLRNSALRFLTAADDGKAATLAYAHYTAATNMTDMMAGLAALARGKSDEREKAFAHFHDRFKNDPLVLDKWMGLQAMSPQPDTMERVKALMNHPAFSMKNPNRVRALIGAFASGNPLRFHDKSGSGYRLVADVFKTLDGINPQTAARMATVFETWRRYDAERQKLIKAELEALMGSPKLSTNLHEIVGKMLG